MKLPLAERKSQILSMLAGSPEGRTSTDMAEVIGLSRYRVAEILGMLRRSGLADLTVQGDFARWTTPDQCQAVRDQMLAAAQLATRQRRAIERKRAAECKEERDAERWLHPTQRRIPATEAPPIKPAGPRCVFELAA